MFLFLSKFIPPFVYPVGLTILLLVLAVSIRNREKWQKRAVWGALIILIIAGNAWVSNWLGQSLEWQYLPNGEIPEAEAIVVLGGAMREQQYPRPMPEIGEAGDRLIYGAKLYHEGKAPLIILTGGTLPWNTSEVRPADSMAQFMDMLGVPREAIQLERQSANTYENALYTRQILAPKGINRIILVTSAMHMPRSVKLYENQGFEVIPAPTDFQVTAGSDSREFSFAAFFIRLMPSVGNIALTTNAIKEYLGILVYGLRGWL